MTHHCPARGCKRGQVPDDYLMCGPHWKLCPADLQRAVWAALRNYGVGSMELFYAQADAIAAVNHRQTTHQPKG